MDISNPPFAERSREIIWKFPHVTVGLIVRQYAKGLLMNGFFLKSLCDYLATGSASSASRAPRGVSPYAEALDESLAEHDKHFHGGNFDPNTMSCSKRDGMSKNDKADSNVKTATPSSRITPEDDAAYADAVNRGDEETALRMIREAAAKAMPDTKVVDEDGLPLVVWHGSGEANFNVFEKGDIGFHFGSWTQALQRNYMTVDHDGVIRAFFVGIKNPLVIGEDARNWNGNGIARFFLTEKDVVGDDSNFGLIQRGGKRFNPFNNMDEELEKIAKMDNDQSNVAMRKLMLENGYDGIIYENEVEGNSDEGTSSFIAFSPSQIKSADITYDGDRLIPLSERFNPKSNDIRYSIVGETAIPSDVLAEAQRKELNGEGREEIYDTTGLWRGQDGNWRMEMPDLDVGTIRKILDWPSNSADWGVLQRGEGGWYSTFGLIADGLPKNCALNRLMKKYPRLATIQLFVYNGKKTPQGFNAVTSQMPSDNYRGMNLKEGQAVRISIAKDRPVSFIRTSLAHELQHFIQGEERWEFGTNSKQEGGAYNPFAKNDYLENAGEVEAHVVGNRAEYGKQEYPWETEKRIKDENKQMRQNAENKNAKEVSAMVSAIKDFVPGVKVSEVEPEEVGRLSGIKDKISTLGLEERTNSTLNTPKGADNVLTKEDLGSMEQVISQGVGGVNGKIRKKIIPSPTGQVAGWYDRNTGEVKLVKGRATAATVAHEIGWHATFHWAEKNHPALHAKLVQYAKEAPEGIEQSVKERYGAKLTPTELLDEVGAERFTREDVSPLLDAAMRRAADGWFDKVDDAQNEARTKFAEANKAKASLSKEELDRISALPPKQAVEELVKTMLEGKTLSGISQSSVQDAADSFARVLVTSDLHTTDLDTISASGASVIVVAGDFMAAGMDSNAAGDDYLTDVFIPWCRSLAPKQIVLTPGNHDKYLYRLYKRGVRVDWPANVHYLVDDAATVDGIRFYGTPWCPNDRPGRFERDERELGGFFAKIPQDLDVLISHCPPYVPGSFVDCGRDGFHEGSKELTEAILRAKPRFCICGHVHASTGESATIGRTKVLNVSRVKADRSKEHYAPKIICVPRSRL